MSNDDVKPTASAAEGPVEPEKPTSARKRATTKRAADDAAAASSASDAPPRRTSSTRKAAAPAAEPAAAPPADTGVGEDVGEPSIAETPAKRPTSRRTTGPKREAAERLASDAESTAEAAAAPSAAATEPQEPVTTKRPRRATSRTKEVPQESAPAAAQAAEAPAAAEATGADDVPEPTTAPARARPVKAHPLTPAAEAPPTARAQAKPEAATEPPTETASPEAQIAAPETAAAQPTAAQPTAAEPAAAEPAGEPATTPVLTELPPASKGERKEYRGSGRRVVVAEDEALIRLDVVETLTEAGFDVVGEAGDGERAVALATELRPDVVVMDIKMPVLDGISAAERIGKARIAPVVLLTAFSQAELVERARDAGAMAYVVKPFTPAELLPAIEIAVARHQEITALESEVADLAERFETRKRVERAKGLLMTKMGLTEPESFRWIQKTSMDRRLTMREVADAVIEQVGGGSEKNR